MYERCDTERRGDVPHQIRLVTDICDTRGREAAHLPFSPPKHAPIVKKPDCSTQKHLRDRYCLRSMPRGIIFFYASVGRTWLRSSLARSRVEGRGAKSANPPRTDDKGPPRRARLQIYDREWLEYRRYSESSICWVVPDSVFEGAHERRAGRKLVIGGRERTQRAAARLRVFQHFEQISCDLSLTYRFFKISRTLFYEMPPTVRTREARRPEAQAAWASG
jgi:hypothetical protein